MIARSFLLQWVRWTARRRLDGVWLRGSDNAVAALAEGPVVFASNHVSWWDGPLAVFSDAHHGAQGRYLTDAHNLSRVPYLRWFGAMDLDRSTPMAALSGLREATRWLDAPGKALWVFPQGRQRPAHLRPLGLERGIEVILRHAKATVVPVGIQYGWREANVPAAALSFGRPVPATLGAIESALEAEIAALDGWFDQPEEALVPLLATKAKVQDGLGARLLAQTAAGRTP